MSGRTVGKQTRARATKRKAQQVPPDDPGGRWRQLAEEHDLGPKEGRVLAGRTKRPEGTLAELRLEALAAVEAMAPSEETLLTPATLGASNWIELGPTAIPNGQTYGGTRVIVTGRVTEIVQHPTDASIIYVATSRGGVWKTEDAGVTWTPKSDNEASLAIGALAVAPSNPHVLYAGTGEGDIYFYTSQYPLSSLNASYNGAGILRSTDGGDSWTLQGTPTFTGACFFRVAVDPTNPDVAYVATNLGLHRTKNGGGTWTQLTGGLPAISGTVIACTDIVVDPTNKDIAYAAFWGSGVYKTTNATAASPAWTKLAGGFPTTDLSRISLAVSPTAPARVYALVANASDGLRGFYTSGNSGGTWTAVAAANGVVDVYGAYTSNVAVDISTPNIVYLSGVELYKAVLTGSTWAVTNVGTAIHPDNHAFASHPTDHLTVYAGSDGGIYKSTDGGATWSDLINEGLAITQFEFIGQHPTSDAYVIGGTQDNGTEIFRNHPAFYHSDDGDGGMAGVDAADPKNVLHTYYGATPQRSTQGGKFGSYTLGLGRPCRRLALLPAVRLRRDELAERRLRDGPDQSRLVAGHERLAGQGPAPGDRRFRLRDRLPELQPHLRRNVVRAGLSPRPVRRLVDGDGDPGRAASRALDLGRRGPARRARTGPRRSGRVRHRSRLARRGRRRRSERDVDRHLGDGAEPRAGHSRQLAPDGSAQPGPPLRRHRHRRLPDDQRRHELAALLERASEHRRLRPAPALDDPAASGCDARARPVGAKARRHVSPRRRRLPARPLDVDRADRAHAVAGHRRRSRIRAGRWRWASSSGGGCAPTSRWTLRLP